MFRLKIDLHLEQKNRKFNKQTGLDQLLRLILSFYHPNWVFDVSVDAVVLASCVFCLFCQKHITSPHPPFFFSHCVSSNLMLQLLMKSWGQSWLKRGREGSRLVVFVENLSLL